MLEESTILALERATGATRAKTAYEIRELVHNFWIEKTSKNHLQVRGHACCLVLHVTLTAICLLSKVEKRELSQLSGYEEKRNGESQVLRAVVQQALDRRVKREKGWLLHFT